MDRISDCTGAELLFEFEIACFNVVKKDSKAAYNRLAKVEAEVAKRLGVSDEELQKVRDRL